MTVAPAQEAGDRTAEVRRLFDAGRYAEAAALARGVLAAVEAEGDPEGLEAAAVIDCLVHALYKDGRNAEPETIALARRAIAIRERLQGPNHPELARSLLILGAVHYLNNDFEAALPPLERGLAIHLETSGPEHPRVAAALNSLASVYADLGDYARARESYERAVAIEHEHGDAYQCAIYRENLATVLVDMGDLRAAVALHEQVIPVYIAKLGAEHPDVAIPLGNLAEVLEDLDELDRARALEEQALRIREARLGPDHRIIAHGLTNLGRILTRQGDYAGARQLLDRALVLRERRFGPDNPMVAITLVALGDLSAREGNRAAARSQYERALSIREARLGPDHPLTARLLDALAALDFAEGRAASGMSRALRAVGIARAQFLRAAASLSEREAVNLSTLLADSLDTALAGLSSTLEATDGPPRDGIDPGVVWEALVRSRAIVLDEMARRQRRVVGREDPSVVKAMADLEKARGRLARLLLAPPPALTAADFGARLRQAQEQFDASERELAKVSAGFREDQRRSRSGLAEVLRDLPSDAALVAYASTGKGYLAFVSRSGSAPPRVVRLGTAEAIEARIDAWRARAAAPPRGAADTAAYREAGDELRAVLWDPLLPALGDARQVLIVPDAAVSLVSFASLPSGEGYLVEGGRRLHYLSAERDLLARRHDGAAVVATDWSTVLVVGGPDFEKRPEARPPNRVARAGRTATGHGKGGAAATEPAFFRGAVPDCTGMRDLRFAPLPGAQSEARAIESLWRKTPAARAEDHSFLRLTGQEAGEAAFKANASGRSILHLATHAFWVQGPCDGVPGDPGRLPLLLSGLALAGANQRDRADPATGEDGILTAQEIATLDLREADWVVLSGCQSGLGFVRRGEGVFGLRRALQVAGAGTLVMTLWPISDHDTRAWIHQLYAARLAGADTPTSMETASRSILAARRAARLSTHPFFWGSFVAAGDWR